MDDRDALTRLRAIVGRGDHAELLAALAHEPWPGDSLQLIGEAYSRRFVMEPTARSTSPRRASRPCMSGNGTETVSWPTP